MSETRAKGSLPGAGTGIEMTREKILRLISERNLTSVANNTKWDRLIAFIRSSEWRPSYRSKHVNGRISGWDVEWNYHLPFPFAGVEWFDIGLHLNHRPGLVDITQIITSKLEEIRFSFEVRGDVVRIWGYFPRSYEDFPPAS